MYHGIFKTFLVIDKKDCNFYIIMMLHNNILQMNKARVGNNLELYHFWQQKNGKLTVQLTL